MSSRGALFIAQMLTRTFNTHDIESRDRNICYSSFQKVAFWFQGSAYLSHAEWSFPCDQRRTQFLLGLNEELTLLLEVQDTVERGLAHQMSYSISTQHHLNGSRNSTFFYPFFVTLLGVFGSRYHQEVVLLLHLKNSEMAQEGDENRKWCTTPEFTNVGHFQCFSQATGVAKPKGGKSAG